MHTIFIHKTISKRLSVPYNKNSRKNGISFQTTQCQATIIMQKDSDQTQTSAEAMPRDSDQTQTSAEAMPRDSDLRVTNVQQTHSSHATHVHTHCTPAGYAGCERQHGLCTSQHCGSKCHMSCSDTTPLPNHCCCLSHPAYSRPAHI